MLTDEQIDEFDVIALKKIDVPPGINPKDWMREFADLVWNEAVKSEREACAEFAEGATQYTQFQTVEHYKIAHFIAAAIRERYSK